MFQNTLTTQLKTEGEFEEILSRIAAQDKMVAEQEKKLAEINKELDAMVQKQDSAILGLAAKVLERQTGFEQRILKLLSVMLLLKKHGLPFTESEIKAQEKVKALRAKLNEEAFEKTLKELNEGLQETDRPQCSALSLLATCTSADSGGILAVAQSLETQNEGLTVLLKKLEESLYCLKIMDDGFK